MKILYVIEQLSCRGGMERIIIDKANWLVEHDQEVTILLLWKDNLPPAYPIDSRIHIEHLNVPRIKGGLSLPLLLWRYNRAIRHLNPDVVCLVWIAAAVLGLYGRRPCRKDGTPSRIIYESHLASEYMKHRWLYPRLGRSIDCVVTLTTGDAANYSDARKVTVIPNFTQLSTDRKPDYQSKHIIWLGRDCYQKDLPRMKRLWEQLSQQHPDWTLDIHTNTKDVTQAYTSGSIFVMTSRYEGWGLTLIESMTCGLPTIAFDCPYGPRDIIEDGVTGYLIPLDRDDRFVERLTYLMEHPDVRREMGEAARQRVQRFDRDTVMQQWISLFENVNQNHAHS